MRAKIIVNPQANSGTSPLQVASMRDALSAQLRFTLNLDDVKWCESEGPGHAQQLAAEATGAGFQYIFAAGGDGTVNEVLNGVMGLNVMASRRPSMGVLPLGTSNDFFEALKRAEAAHRNDNNHSPTLALDVGHVTFDRVERYFCLTVGLGLFSWANEQYLEASQVFGRRFGHVPAAIKTLLSYRFLPNVKIGRDGKRPRGRRVLSVVVDNSPSVAGGTPLTPAARIDDGYLDVLIVKPVSLLRLIALALKISTKTPTRSQEVLLGRIRELTVIAKQPLPIHIDGELIPEIGSKARRMVVKVLPGALRFVLPSLCEISPEAVVS